MFQIAQGRFHAHRRLLIFGKLVADFSDAVALGFPCIQVGMIVFNLGFSGLGLLRFVIPNCLGEETIAG